jgi:hypothetical protein
VNVVGYAARREESNVLCASDYAQAFPQSFGMVNLILSAFGAEDAMNQVAGQSVRHYPML